MKTAATDQEISLEKIEKNTVQILKKVNSMLPNLFESEIKFSEKAKEEKMFLFRSLTTRLVTSFETNKEVFLEILGDANFSKLEKKDQDLILELDQLGFKDSQYIKEIKSYVDKEKDVELISSVIMKESIYFTTLNIELNSISTKLLHLIKI